jgi:hypothetical protein
MIKRPSDMFDSRTPLNGLRVGIAGAIPERQWWGEVADLDRLILTFVAQLSALVLRYGGRLVHGSQPLLTPIVAEQACLQSRERSESLTLVASQLFGAIPEVAQTAAETARASMIVTAKQGEGDARDADTRNKSLTAMRLALMQEIDVLVAIGGKLHVESGFNPGVLEELAMARWHGLPTFIVGAFGGVAGELERALVKELSGDNLMDSSSGAPSSIEMAQWSGDMDEYVGKLLAHFLRHQEQLRAGKRFEHPVSSFVAIEAPKSVAESVLTQSRFVSVNPEVVEQWSSRFVNFRNAAERKNVEQARDMLR